MPKPHSMPPLGPPGSPGTASAPHSHSWTLAKTVPLPTFKSLLMLLALRLHSPSPTTSPRTHRICPKTICVLEEPAQPLAAPGTSSVQGLLALSLERSPCLAHSIPRALLSCPSRTKSFWREGVFISLCSSLISDTRISQPRHY